MHQPLKTIYELRLNDGIRYPLATVEDIKYYMKTHGDQIKCPECFRSKIAKVPALNKMKKTRWREIIHLEKCGSLIIKDLM